MLRLAPLARRTGPRLLPLLPHVGRSLRPAPSAETRRGAWQGARNGGGASQDANWSNAECLTVVGLALAAAAGTAAAYKAASKSLAAFIKGMIEKYDTSFIGVDITIGTLYIYPLHAKAQILDITIMNPPGWESPYMMKAGKITLDLDWFSIISPWSKKIIVEKATFKHATVNIEYHHLWENTSNLDEIAQRAHHPDKDPHPEWKKKKEVAQTKNAKNKKDWWFDEVKLVDLNVNYNRGMFKENIMLPDIVYDHFSEQVGSNVLDDVLIILLQFIVTNVVSHLASPAIAASLTNKHQDEDERRATLARHTSWNKDGAK